VFDDVSTVAAFPGLLTASHPQERPVHDPPEVCGEDVSRDPVYQRI